MARLADGFVNELKGRIDLYDVVSPYVQLKKVDQAGLGLARLARKNRPLFMSTQTKVFSNASVLVRVGMRSRLSKKLKTWSSLKRLNFLLSDSVFRYNMLKKMVLLLSLLFPAR